MNKLSIIIITWNDIKNLLRCLDSIYKNQPAGSFEVIVVDNGSLDGTAFLIEEKYPNIKLIKNEKNLGVAEARNHGLNNATGEYVLFLDSDAEILDGTIDHLKNHLELHPEVVLVGPALVYGDHSLQLSCRKFPSPAVLIFRYLFGDKNVCAKEYLMSDWDHNSNRNVDWVMGAAMMTRSRISRLIGGFNKKYFIGYDDVDFCYRLSKTGGRVTYLSSAKVVHHYQRKSSKLKFNNRFMWLHIKSIIRFFSIRPGLWFKL